MSETRVVADGLGFPESTRWHDGRAWLCNWGAGEVLAVSSDGEREVIARLAPQTIPLSIDWLPDGRMLVVDGPQGRLLRQEPDGTLDTAADLTALAARRSMSSWSAQPGTPTSTEGQGSCASSRTAACARSRTACSGPTAWRWPTMAVCLSSLIRTLSSSSRSRWPTTGPSPAAASGLTLSRRPTASAWTRTVPCGSRAFPASAACACGRAARCSAPFPSIEGALPACSAARMAGRCSSRPRNGTGCRRR